MAAKTKNQLMAELVALQQRITELETEQRQREIELEHWLAAERESWALAEALNQTGAAIGSSLRGEEVLDRILEEMSRVVACDAACLLLIEADVARVYRWRGYIRSERATPEEIVSAALDIEQVPVLRAVRKTSRPLAVSAPQPDDAWVNKFGLVWVKSYACAPIRSRGRVVGFLTVDSETPDFFEAADAEPLQAFADQAARALENVGVHNRIRTEIVKRLKMLKKERNFISAVLDTADALVIALNQAGRIVHFNRACEQISGYTFAEVRDRYLGELLSAENDGSTRRYFTEPLPNHPAPTDPIPAKFESYLLTKTGERRLIAWSNTSLLDKAGAVEYIIVTGLDITDRRRAEEALRQSEERFRQGMELSPNAIFFVDRTGLIQEWNQACINLFQYGREIIGQSYQKLLWSSEDYALVEGYIARVFQKQSFKAVELSFRSQGGERRFTVSRLYPIYDIDGNVQDCVFSSSDITHEKQTEEALRLQNEQLQARNQELDAFARTVAHDLKNPLGVLTPMAEILLEDYQHMPPEKLGEYLETIARSGRRASQIVEALLLLAGARQRNVTLEPLDMAAIVSEALQRLEPMITDSRAEIITPTTWPVALGYGPWVEEIWVNYLSNGLKYGGQPPHLELGAAIRSDGMAHFWLRDNGPGLTSEAQAQLFTEFTQLEPDRMEEGHGLGLSIVRRIVEKLGGQVGIESTGRPGQGSIFSFTLPLARS